MGYAHLRVASNQNRIVAYTLSSTGPSKYHMLVIYWLQPEILFNQYPFMSYDPSNGLVSMGEIVAWGGDSSKIHVMMNGKEYDGQFPPDYAR